LIIFYWSINTTVYSCKQNKIDENAKSDLPLNLSTSSDNDGAAAEQVAVDVADAVTEVVEQSDSEDEETLQRKHQLLYSLSLSDTRQMSLQSPESLSSEGDVMTSSPFKRTSTSLPLSADWDWEQLTYGSDRKRAKKEETGNHQSSRVARGSTSLFEFVVMTSFTDAYAKFRLQRKRKDPPEEDEQEAITVTSSERNASEDMLNERTQEMEVEANEFDKTTLRGATLTPNDTSNSRVNR